MSQDSTNIEFKLSPTASIGLIILLVIGAGVIYLIKPELVEKYLSQATSGAVDTLPRESYFPQLEESLKLRLKGELLTELASRRAPQSEYDAIKDIQINSISANPVGYFKSERAFWQESDLRHVNITLTFTSGGQPYQAKGDFTVSGVADNIILGTLKIQP